MLQHKSNEFTEAQFRSKHRLKTVCNAFRHQFQITYRRSFNIRMKSPCRKRPLIHTVVPFSGTFSMIMRRTLYFSASFSFYDTGLKYLQAEERVLEDEALRIEKQDFRLIFSVF